MCEFDAEEFRKIKERAGDWGAFRSCIARDRDTLIEMVDVLLKKFATACETVTTLHNILTERGEGGA